MRTFHLPLPLLLLTALAPLGFPACASHGKPKPAPSSWRMIEEGDNNPFIHDAPERAGTIIKDDNGPR